MTKVYVVNKGAHNHDDAKRFGELVYMTEGSISRFATSNMYRQFCFHLRGSKPEDYILMTGLSVMASLACSVFTRLHGRLNLLLYRAPHSSSDQGHYVERTVMLDELLWEKDVNINRN